MLLGCFWIIWKLPDGKNHYWALRLNGTLLFSKDVFLPFSEFLHAALLVYILIVLLQIGESVGRQSDRSRRQGQGGVSTRAKSSSSSSGTQPVPLARDLSRAAASLYLTTSSHYRKPLQGTPLGWWRAGLCFLFPLAVAKLISRGVQPFPVMMGGREWGAKRELLSSLFQTGSSKRTSEKFSNSFPWLLAVQLPLNTCPHLWNMLISQCLCRGGSPQNRPSFSSSRFCGEEGACWLLIILAALFVWVC